MHGSTRAHAGLGPEDGLDSGDEACPLWRGHAGLHGDRPALGEREHGLRGGDGYRADTVERAVLLVVPLEVDAAVRRMLRVLLDAEEDVVRSPPGALVRRSAEAVLEAC